MGFELFVGELEEEEDLEIEIDRKLEKKEGGGDDWFEVSSDISGVVDSEENGRGEAGCLTRMMFVSIVLSAASSVPRSVKKNPKGVK